jgi:hypothetical protein
MKTLLQLAFASLARIDLGHLRKIWNAIEGLVSGLELAQFRDGSMTGAEKLAYVLERVGKLIPEDRREISAQIIRAIVELILIGIRLRKKEGA